jgi:hypothetical protein
VLKLCDVDLSPSLTATLRTLLVTTQVVEVTCHGYRLFLPSVDGKMARVYSRHI